MKIAFALAALLCLFPARSSHADPAADNAKLAERAMVMMEDIATVVDQNKDKCDPMGDKLNALIDKNAGLLKQLKEAGKTMTPEQKKQFSDKYKDRTQAVITKMTPGMTNCAKNAKVTAAMSRAAASN